MQKVMHRKSFIACHSLLTISIFVKKINALRKLMKAKGNIIVRNKY